MYLLQLCQVLKFEPFLDSALSRFLLRRALRNKTHVGHMYFWYLQAEMHIVDVQLRYGFMLELYLRNCGEHRVALGHQMFVMERLHEVALEAQSTPSKRCTAVVRKRLAAITFPERFQLPLDPQMQVCGLLPEKCKAMSSKKRPLWLTFRRYKPRPGEEHLTVLFKAGDDLRQDQLTLQFLRLMDGFWRNAGMDMCMNAYVR